MLEQLEAQFQQALQAHSAGQWVQAEKGYRDVLAALPDHHQAHHYLGLVLAAQEQFERAHSHLQLAVEGKGNDVQYLYNLGLVLRRLGRASEALAVFARATAEQADSPVLLQQSAAAAMDAGQFDQAAVTLQKLCDLQPENAEYWSALGLAQRYGGQLNAAKASLDRAQGLDPSRADTLLAAAELAVEQGEHAHAVELFQRCLAAAPHWVDAMLRFAEFQLHIHDTEAVTHWLQRLERMAPDDPRTLLLAARWALSIHDLNLAQAKLDALEGSASSLPVHAIDLLQIKVMRARGDEHALDRCDQLLSDAPDLAEAHLMRALVLTDRGRFDEADLSYRQAVQFDRSLTQTYPLRARIRRVAQGDDLVRDIEQRLDETLLSDAQQGDLLFALGKAYDDQGRFKRAFECYQQANTLRCKRFDREAHSRWVDMIIEGDSAWPAGGGSDSRQPVFIVGMPRSGTSLLQQCLSRHPQIAAAGELDAINQLAGSDYPRSVLGWNASQRAEAVASYLSQLQASGRGEEVRICDKMPMNFLFIGLIRRLFPRASIVHCRRHPIATCLSNFFQDFEFGNDYSYQLEDLASYYRDYQRLMSHWRQSEAVNMIEISYEALVLEQEQTLRRVSAFIGVDWDDALLDHTGGGRGISQTASTWQVRQPMYARSVDHWKHYRQWLEPLGFSH